MEVFNETDFDSLSDEDYVVITTQESLFFSIAQQYHVWFPSSSTTHGLKPTKYVAYYLTKDADGNGSIIHIARNRKAWYETTGYEAESQSELKELFSDPKFKGAITSWGMAEKRHFVLTDAPQMLEGMLRVDPKRAKFVTKKRFSKEEWNQLLKAGKWPAQ